MDEKVKPLRSVMRECMERLKREYPNLSELTINVCEAGDPWQISWTMFGDSGELEL